MISRNKIVSKIKLNLDEFGDDYYAIGTDFNKSTFSAVTSKDKDKNFTITNSNQLVYEFLSLPGNIYFMDFKKAKSNSDLKDRKSVV